jgi:hypothetical protein
MSCTPSGTMTSPGASWDRGDMAAGISPTLARCIEVCLQYLGLDGKHRKLLTTEPIVGVAGDGDLVTEDALLRTSGDTTAIQAGETMPVLWSRASSAPGVRAAKPTVALRHHAQKAQPMAPSITAPFSVEELFVSSEMDTPSTFIIRLYLRNRSFVTELSTVLTQIAARVPYAAEEILISDIRWGNDAASFALRIHVNATPAFNGIAVFRMSPRPSVTGSWTSPPTPTLQYVLDLATAIYSLGENWMLDRQFHILSDYNDTISLDPIGNVQRGYLVDVTSGAVLMSYGSGGFGNTGAARLLYADGADLEATIMVLESAELSDSPPGTSIPISISIWTGSTRIALPGATLTLNPTPGFGLLAYGRARVFYGVGIFTNPEATASITTIYQSDMRGNAVALASAASGAAGYLVRFLLAGSANTGIDAFYQFARRDQLTTLPLPANLVETFINTTPRLDLQNPTVDPTRPVVPLADLPRPILAGTEIVTTTAVQFLV